MDQMEFIIDDVRVEYDLESLGRKLRIRSSARAEALLKKLVEEAEAIARPRAGFKHCAMSFGEGDEVIVDGMTFNSTLLRENFEGLGRVFPFLATEGSELAEWGRAYSGMDRIFANTIQQEAMRMARSKMESFIMDKFGLPQVSAMNPGSLIIWPITQQVPLFKLLSPLDEKLGVTLLPTFMMKPEQTVSGFFFQTDSKFHNCQLCPREDCPNRQAPYSGMD
ncbi:hypothetical protein C4J81_08825 [Deltaproteobacteria bacterium Smac51]|nr:hypothetical protein C4J81_08825 [Deltaproteobacteria bacterium Smac51]